MHALTEYRRLRERDCKNYIYFERIKMTMKQNQVTYLEFSETEILAEIMYSDTKMKVKTPINFPSSQQS